MSARIQANLSGRFLIGFREAARGEGMYATNPGSEEDDSEDL